MKNIVELLNINALENKNDLALQDEDGFLTYGELFDLVLQRASFIKDLGLVNSPIIVKVNRSKESIVNFLAVLLSNNHYIPVDEDIPLEKLNKIIKASKAEYVIPTKEDDSGLKVIDFTNGKNVYPFEEFSKDFNEKNYSFIMFTSGSTGDPKGVIKNHKNIISFVENYASTFPFLGQERIANQTPFFFDASAKDIYLSLKLKAALFIPAKTRFSLPLETVKFLNENKITYISWVPSILTMIAKTRTLNYVKPEFLKYVFFVGEVFQPKYLNMWIEALPNVRYFNIYGSTEVMGVSLYYEIKKHFEGESIPTGKALKNNDVYLVDGEIVVNSDQVAVGYLNNNESKTFEYVNGRNLLHTGDFASYDSEQNIVFSSRKDYQIKHLGYRIELQEIEASLINLDYISQCCAVYDDSSDKIILFVSLNRDIEEPNRKILVDAKEKLQFYMVPNKVIVLNELPLNNNGKLDRLNLKRGYQDGRY